MADLFDELQESPQTREHYLARIRAHMQSAYLLDERKIDQVLPQFLATLRGHLDTLPALIEAADGTGFAKACHTLKGALLNLGLADLADQAANLEHEAIKDQPLDQLSQEARLFFQELEILTRPD